jgi:SET domain-containing protein
MFPGEKMDPYKLSYIAPSDIHGKGLFAKVGIEQGAFIGTYKGPEAKRNGSHVLWVYDDDGEVIGRRGLNKLRYLNHCDSPNAEFDGFDLYTLREIDAGEEITINYDAV